MVCPAPGFRKIGKLTVKGLDQISSRLSRLEVDFTNAYCPMGCCRALDIVCWEVLRQLSPKKIRAVWLKTGEVPVVKESVEVGCNGREIKLVCNPTDDPWEKWRLTKDEAETETG
jgi:hypothetical protein